MRFALLILSTSLSLALAQPAIEAKAETFTDPPLSGPVFVVGTDNAGLQVRSGPGMTYDVLGILSEGSRARITNGPRFDGDQDWYQVRSSDSGAEALRGWVAAKYLLAADGTRPMKEGYRATRTFNGTVTSYASVNGVGVITATGSRVRWGTVAVDPSFIRYGSLLEIDGLNGVFIAEDTGPGVRGAIIDVWFPDLAGALRWGTQQRKVTVLREGY